MTREELDEAWVKLDEAWVKHERESARFDRFLRFYMALLLVCAVLYSAALLALTIGSLLR